MQSRAAPAVVRAGRAASRGAARRLPSSRVLEAAPASSRALHASACAASADKPAAGGGEKPAAGGLFGRLQQELDATVAANAELKKAFEAGGAAPGTSDSAAAASDGAAQQQADSASSAAAGDAASSASSDSSAAAGGAKAGGPVRRSFVSRLWDDAKDVLSVTLGWERTRDLAAEYASGERPYPWVTYVEPGTEKRLYRNTESGVVTEIQPPDWATFATAAHELTPDVDASALATVRTQATAWDRTLDAVSRAPLVSALVDAAATAGAAVAASPVGQAAGKAKARVADRIEDAREVWETSQHPLVVNASYLVDSMMAETEQGRAIKAITEGGLASFDPYQFVQDMQEKLMPELARAFFRLDMPTLRRLCRDSALAQMKAVAAARAIEGVSHDGVILNVSKCEMTAARTLEQAGEGGGSLPVILTTAQVQYIHTVRNAKGEIVEGSESEIRAAFFILAVTREYDPASGQMIWRVVEMTMQGAMQYL